MNDDGTISTDSTKHLTVEVDHVTFLSHVTFEEQVGFKTSDEVKVIMKDINRMSGKPDEPVPEYIAVA